MLTIFIRTILIYLFLIVVMRLMGKKQLGELQPFEFVITLVASELACIPLSDMQTPLFYGFIPILTLLCMEIIVTKIVKHSIKMRKIINGKPVIVIDKDGINVQAISKVDMTMHDLLEGIRSQGYSSPKELEFAIVETNGNISCFPKAEYKPATAKDVNGDLSNPLIPYTIISEGKLISDNLDKIDLHKDFVDTLLKNNNLRQKDVLFLAIDEQSYYLQPLKGKYIEGQNSEV